MYISMYKLRTKYAFMCVTTEMIAGVMGKGLDGKGDACWSRFTCITSRLSLEQSR